MTRKFLEQYFLEKLIVTILRTSAIFKSDSFSNIKIDLKKNYWVHWVRWSQSYKFQSLVFCVPRCILIPERHHPESIYRPDTKDVQV